MLIFKNNSFLYVILQSKIMSIISKDIQKAIDLLTNENLVAIPTETVYGLAGNIFIEESINKIYQLEMEREIGNLKLIHTNRHS